MGLILCSSLISLVYCQKNVVKSGVGLGKKIKKEVGVATKGRLPIE